MIMRMTRRWVAGRLGALVLAAMLALGVGALHAAHLAPHAAEIADPHDHHDLPDHHAEVKTPSCCFLPACMIVRTASAMRVAPERPPVGRSIDAVGPAPPNPPPRSV
ncbi:MAG: hypothetical protein ACK4WC_16925 [Rubrimonas sp.]